MSSDFLHAYTQEEEFTSELIDKECVRYKLRLENVYIRIRISY